MAIYNQEYTNYILNKDKMSFDEAVNFLIESYNLSEEDAIFVVEDYIEEASAKDAYKAKDQGERIYGQKRGMRITNHELNEPDHTMLDKSSDDMRKSSEEYYAKDKINMDKVNNVKDKTDKEKIRDSTRSKSGSVPEHGANPKYSRDADKKSVEAYKRATSKNPYKDIDIEKSTEGMSEKKAAMVKKDIERGANLPDSIKKRLVKKDKKSSSLTKHGNISIDAGGRKLSYDSSATYGDKKDSDIQKDRLQKMRTTTDPAEYHINRKQFLKDMGEKDYKGTINHPIKIEDSDGKEGFAFKKDKDEEKEDKNTNKKSYYHTSHSNSIKELNPTPKGGEGSFFPQSRIYASKDTPTYRNGVPIGKKHSSNYTRYKLDDKDTKDRKVFVDNFADDKQNARYFKTSKPMKVKDIDK